MPMAKIGLVLWWCAVACLAALMAAIGLAGIGAGIERTDRSLLFFGISLAALSVSYFYRRRPDGAPMPRFALAIGALGLVSFLLAAALARNIL